MKVKEMTVIVSFFLSIYFTVVGRAFLGSGEEAARLRGGRPVSATGSRMPTEPLSFRFSGRIKFFEATLQIVTLVN